MDDFKKWATQKALEQSGGSKAEAARRLGISRSTLYRWIKKYGLETDQR